MPLYLTEAEVEGLISAGEAVPVIEACFRRLAAGAVENVPRRRIGLEDGTFAVMSAVDRELGYAGLKSYAVVGGKAAFVVCLFELERGGLLAAVLEAKHAGRASHRCRERGGCQASRAFGRAQPRRDRLWLAGGGTGGRDLRGGAVDRARRRLLPHAGEAERLLRRRRTRNRPRSPSDAAAQDVVVTATTSRDPVLRGEWLRDGALVCAIGANDSGARELDNVVLERATFVCCDSR